MSHLADKPYPVRLGERLPRAGDWTLIAVARMRSHYVLLAVADNPLPEWGCWIADLADPGAMYGGRYRDSEGRGWACFRERIGGAA